MRPPPVRYLAEAFGLLAVGASNAWAAPPLRPAPPTFVAGAPLRLPASPWAESQALNAAGVARTAVDRGFAGGSAQVAAGFLCGRTPTPAAAGVAGALGVDRDGRFLGAQLRLAFH